MKRQNESESETDSEDLFESEKPTKVVTPAPKKETNPEKPEPEVKKPEAATGSSLKKKPAGGVALFGGANLFGVKQDESDSEGSFDVILHL